MSRVRNEAAAAARRQTFIDVAAGLIVARGYDAMSIQDVIDAVGASKGAFYHYFDSKEELLDAIVEHTADQVAAAVPAEVAHGGVQGLRGLYGAVAAAKGERAQLIRELAAVWYSDGNALMRERARAAITTRLAPVVAQLLAEGTRHGDFQVADHEQTARIVVDLILDLNDRVGRGAPGPVELARVVDAHEGAVCRILAIDGTVRLVDREGIESWADRGIGES